jgi:hypothetical protein
VESLDVNEDDFFVRAGKKVKKLTTQLPKEVDGYENPREDFTSVEAGGLV